MNSDATVFKPDPIIVQVAGVDYSLVYDLNAFCELEKIYPSVDGILQMLLGTTAAPDLKNVTYRDITIEASDVKVDGTPLSMYVGKLSNAKEARHTDTLNLLWAGCLHNHIIYDNFGEIKSYSITKAKLGAGVTFKNLREINSKILMAILRDLIPSAESKNAEAPEPVEEKPPQVVLHK